MPHAPLSESRLHAWLTLLRAPGVGASRLRKLLALAGDAERALALPDAEWQRCGLPAAALAWRASPDHARIAADLAWLEAPDHHLIPCDSADFPALLARSAQPPAALFVAGDPDLLWHPQIALVGSRNASEGGLDNARDFARTLARAGFAITSGLADGIDAAAHRATLAIEAKTLAVVGTGPDLVYPAKHRSLAGDIARHGAVVSEFPPGTEARREHFPRRNAIIAGLSLGTLVVEAGLQSGALITARLAAEAGREVFALPGSIHNPLAKGCHRLIRDGAALVETAQEIIEALGATAAQLARDLRGRLDADATAAPTPPQPVEVGTDPDYQRLWRALDHDPTGIDVLAARSGLTVEVLSSMLLLMELDGRVSAAHGRYAKRSS
jgi:DNA processing protein